MIEVNLHSTGGKGSRISAGKLSISLPDAFKPDRRSGGGESVRDVWTTIAIAVPALVVVVVGFLWFSTRSERTQLEESLVQAVGDSTRLSDLRVLSDSLIGRDVSIQERLNLVQSLDGDRYVWSHMLDEISRAIPAYTWLTLVRREGTLPDLRVQVDGLSANPLAITRFVRNLQDSPYVSEVRIMGSQQQLIENVAAQAFQLMVSYQPPPDELIQSEPLTGGP